MPLLDVRNLTTDFITPDGAALRAVEGVSFTLEPGQALGLVGESGCGKTTAMLSLLRLLPHAGRIAAGQALFEGEDLLGLTPEEFRRRRWRDLAMVFQGAMNALNPVRTVGDQIREAIATHYPWPRDKVAARVAELLELVGIPSWRAAQYPFEYSGGMRQRAMIAMALACDPRLVVADEPTTALDVMIQAQIMDLLGRLRRDLNLAMIVVTHDLGVVAEACQQVLVMYGGRVAEYGPVEQVFGDPRHPYTQRLLRAFPALDSRRGELASIPGSPPRLSALPTGCRFHPRCPLATDRCVAETPEPRPVADGQLVACHLA
jgi:oligopeptide/dipeptide ABC transporter ATP-binding protein